MAGAFPLSLHVFYDRRELFCSRILSLEYYDSRYENDNLVMMGVENVLHHSHKTIQKQSIKPKGSEYDKVF